MLELLKPLAALLVALPTTWATPQPETPKQREARIETIVEADIAAVTASVVPETQHVAILFATIAIQRNETGFDYAVHAGLPSAIGSSGGGKAKCLGQLETWPGNRLLTPEQWNSLEGTDLAATTRCAAASVAYLWYHAERCLRRDEPKETRWTAPLTDDEVLRLFAAYGKGHCAAPQPSNERRLKSYRRLRAALEADS